MTNPSDTTRLAVPGTVERIFLSDPSCVRGYVLVDCLGLSPRIVCTPGAGYTIDQVASRAFALLDLLHPETSEATTHKRYHFKVTLDLDAASSHQRLTAHDELRRSLKTAGVADDEARRLLRGEARAEAGAEPHLP